MKARLWAVGPAVCRRVPDGAIHWLHGEPVLHRVFIEEIGGIGEPNAGEFLVETPCGYKGWVSRLNVNVGARPVCEACLNSQPTAWWRSQLPNGAELAPS